jgi:NADPH-dependent 2,4-dienoyl-CoA reductase/sulfur reductase-like enzyme/nitrite reductase/ring-hydroxylating ferredoxin subunit
MGGDAEKPEGPDLKSEGMALAGLADGAAAVGHADGEAVLVVRRGESCYAVGARCTHYSGPLEQGLVVGDTVRCPWHHACFSLRTGEAVRAPALNPLPRWEVIRRGDRVYVGARTQPDPLAQSPATARVTSGTFVIVGTGAAGHAAAEMLRRHGFGGRIVLIGADPAPPYDRPNLSKDYLAGDAPEEWIPLRPAEFYEEHAIDLVTGHEVDRVDPEGRRVHLASGDAYAFDKLLLATGAEPVRLDLPGAAQPHVHVLRSLGQSRAIIAAAERATSAVVVGASFIGLETAAALRRRGLAVRVVAPEARPLERVLGPEIGAWIRRLHESQGVVFHLERRPARIEADAVILDSGERVPGELVVLGVGVRPSLALAERAGLSVERGVVVDAFLETSAPGIFAAGDIARWPDPRTGDRIRVEHWVVAQRQGQTAARNMLGERLPYTDVPFFWSAHYDVSIRYVGHAERWDRIEIDGDLDRRDAAATFVRGGRRLAVATVGRDRAALEAAVEMEREGSRA